MHYFFDIEFIRAFNNACISDYVRSDFINFIHDLKYSPYKKINCIIFHDEELDITDIEANSLYELLCDSNISFKKKADLTNILEDVESTSFKFFFLDTILPGTNIPADYGFYATTSKELDSNWNFVSSKYRTRKTLSHTASPYTIANWTDMYFCKMPINSIVFSDRYFLKDRTNFEINLFELLNNLGLSPLKKRKVDIFMISEVFREVDKNEDSEIKRKKDNEQFLETFMKLSEFLNKCIGEDKYNFTLVKVDKQSEVKPKDIHERLLYTNVLFINPGNSFDFFEFSKNGPKAKPGTIINFDNFLWDGARGPNFEILNQLKKAFEKVCDRQPIGSQKPIYRVLTHNMKTCGLFK